MQFVSWMLGSWLLPRVFSAFSTAASSCASDGSRPKKGSGSSDDTLQITKRSAKLWKFPAVTPSSFVSPAPSSPPVMLPPLQMDIRVANSVASTPGGQSLAASTSMGIKETWIKHKIPHWETHSSAVAIWVFSSNEFKSAWDRAN